MTGAAFASLCVLAFATASIEAADNCINCICKVESQCRAIGCHMDVGSLSCGYYQIKLPYYKDCGKPGMQPGESVVVAWKRCANDLTCATTCVKKYIKRYKHDCPQFETNKCEGTARLHNGGPHGCKNANTLKYWNRVKKCCHCT